MSEQILHAMMNETSAALASFIEESQISGGNSVIFIFVVTIKCMNFVNMFILNNFSKLNWSNTINRKYFCRLTVTFLFAVYYTVCEY